MMVYANVVANALGIFTLAIIIALFVTWLKHTKEVNLNAKTGFTTWPF
jgi:fluoride ion exporter CrcB/FEX